jgi:hypothetical protein
MLTQGIRNDSNRHLLVISSCEDCMRDSRTREIEEKLDLNGPEKQQISIHAGTAKQFLESSDLARILLEKIPKNQDAPF